MNLPKGIGALRDAGERCIDRRPGTACAQSSVSLYGLIDAGLTYTSNQGGSSNVQAASGAVNGSRWGLRGSEDLAGTCRPSAPKRAPSPGFGMAQAARYFGARCRTASNRHTPLATDTLRLSTVPAIGICITSSQVSRVRRRMPSPSAPMTSATGPSSFAS